VEKSGTARQATDDNIAFRMRIALWITTATDTHSEYEKFTRTRLNVTFILILLVLYTVALVTKVHQL